jgi:hypothetical protein
VAINLVPRRDWGAQGARGAVTTIRKTKGVKIHYVGSRVDPSIEDDHSLCTELVQAIQVQHQDRNGWIDFGYSLAVCPHRSVYVGRGPNRLPAANGPGLNSDHYAVLGLVGSKGLTIPSDNMLLGILDAIEYLRGTGGAGKEIKGHRDGYATECPGTELYRWITAGCPRPDVPQPKPPVNNAPQWPGRYFEYERGQPLMQGDDIATWQRRMSRRGWIITVDGWYGPQSERVCRLFQVDKNLWTDGIVGPQTWAATWSAPIT